MIFFISGLGHKHFVFAKMTIFMVRSQKRPVFLIASSKFFSIPPYFAHRGCCLLPLKLEICLVWVWPLGTEFIQWKKSSSFFEYWTHICRLLKTNFALFGWFTNCHRLHLITFRQLKNSEIFSWNLERLKSVFMKLSSTNSLTIDT